MNTQLEAKRMVVVAVMLAGVIASCGGATKSANDTTGRPIPVTAEVVAATVDPSEGSGTDDAACHLLSESDVTTAMQQPMKVVGGAGAAVCTYAATADPSVLLAVQTFENQQDASLYSSPEASSEHIDGLGDDTFWNSTLDMVFVKSGERSFAVTSPSLANLTGDIQASKAAMVALAKIVLSTF